jgi:hypothetical protein
MVWQMQFCIHRQAGPDYAGYCCISLLLHLAHQDHQQRRLQGMKGMQQQLLPLPNLG